MEFENKIVLATAFASHRVNGGYFPDTRRFSEGTATLFSNKEMMTYNLTPEDDKLIPSDFTKFNITEEDYKNAELGVAFLMKENALQIIAGTLTDFMKNFLSLIKAEKIQRDNFGIVCLLPKIYFERSYEIISSKLTVIFLNNIPNSDSISYFLIKFSKLK